MDLANIIYGKPDSRTEPPHAEVERLAFKFWMERGRPLGTPDIDWFRAEAELAAAPGKAEDPLLAAARTIGSALGSLSALLGSDR